MHSTSITSSTLTNIGDKITIEFTNFNISEEIRINSIFKNCKISKPNYNESYTHFTRTYTKNK